MQLIPPDPPSVPHMRETLQVWYLDWRNNFLTVERFAEYYCLNLDQAVRVIELGRSVHESSEKLSSPRIQMTTRYW